MPRSNPQVAAVIQSFRTLDNSGAGQQAGTKITSERNGVTRIALGCAGATLGLAMPLPAGGDFLLEFRTIPAREVMAFPGGSAASRMLPAVKPAALKEFTTTGTRKDPATDSHSVQRWVKLVK